MFFISNTDYMSTVATIFVFGLSLGSAMFLIGVDETFRKKL